MALTLEELSPDWPVYGPEAGTDLPGIVLLHGAEGPGAGWSHRFAAILAAHGFLALPVSYGAGSVLRAGLIDQVPIDAFTRAGEALLAHSRCAAVGVFGWSKGSEAALLLAALDPGPFRAFAVHAPFASVTGAFDPETFLSSGTIDRDPCSRPCWIWPGHEDALIPGRPIPIERATLPLFISSGTRDDIAAHSEALQLAERARRSVDLFVAHGQGHALSMGFEPTLWASLFPFFRTHLTEDVLV
ncbi:MAG: prolyl oligopeptidase family serine peptidase [Pseudomonadota bacterium]